MSTTAGWDHDDDIEHDDGCGDDPEHRADDDYDDPADEYRALYVDHNHKLYVYDDVNHKLHRRVDFNDDDRGRTHYYGDGCPDDHGHDVPLIYVLDLDKHDDVYVRRPHHDAP
jgi:hypothetical protein